MERSFPSAGQRLFDARVHAGGALALDQSPISGRATKTKSCRGGSLSESAQKASRRARLTRLRSTAPPTLRLTETPSRTSSALLLVLAGEAVEHEVAGGM